MWGSQVKGPESPPPLFFFLNTEQSDDLGVIHTTPAGVPWSADIVLNDTRVSDAGTYRCMVNNPPETPDPGIGELELSVVGTWVAPGQPGVPSGWGKTSVNHVFLLSFYCFVCLAPPSLPVCQWDGDVNAGGSVTLSCSVAEGTPTPEIRWTKLNPQEVELPINMDGELRVYFVVQGGAAQT